MTVNSFHTSLFMGVFYMITSKIFPTVETQLVVVILVIKQKTIFYHFMFQPEEYTSIFFGGGGGGEEERRGVVFQIFQKTFEQRHTNVTLN